MLLPATVALGAAYLLLIDNLARTVHFPDHALLIANQVALMKEGRFIALGSPGEVVTEANLEQLYGVQVRIVAVGDDGPGDGRRAVVPLLHRRLKPESVVERLESCPQ